MQEFFKKDSQIVAKNNSVFFLANKVNKAGNTAGRHIPQGV